MTNSHIRMTPITDRTYAGQWLIFCGQCQWQTVELNRTTADLAIRRESHNHRHDSGQDDA